MDASDLNIHWSEMAEYKSIFSGVKQVSFALYFKGLITFEEAEFCVKTGFIPKDLSTIGLEQVFEYGLVLDPCKDAFAFFSMRVLLKDLTLFN